MFVCVLHAITGHNTVYRKRELEPCTVCMKEKSERNEPLHKVCTLHYRLDFSLFIHHSGKH